MKKRGLKIKGLSVFITLGILSVLIFAGPVKAFIIGLVVSDTSPLRGDIIYFTASIDIENNERLPIENLSLILSGPMESVCIFYPNSTIISGCDGISIVQNTVGYSYGLGYGYYGYGYNFGYGYGFTEGKLEYNITLNTTNYLCGLYKTKLSASMGNKIFLEQGDDVTIRSPINITYFSVSPPCITELDSVTVSANIIPEDQINNVILTLNINGTWTNKTAIHHINGNYSYIINSSELQNGIVYWQFIVQDSFGFTYGSMQSFYVHSKTSLSVSPPSPDGLNNWYVKEPAFNLSNSNASNIWYRWDGSGAILYIGPFGLENISNPPPESAGTLELTWWSDVCSVVVGENETKQNKTFYIDLTDPLIKDLVPENNSVVYNDLRPTIQTYLDEVYESNSGINNDSVIIKADGVDVTDNADVSYAYELDAIINYIPTSDLSKGQHNVSVNVSDKAGRNSELTWQFNINITPVFTMVVYSPENMIYDSRRVQFNISLSEKIEKIEYIDWSDSMPRWKILCRECKDYGRDRKKSKTFTDGFHNISIRGTDYFVNSKEVNVSFFVDSKDPRILKTKPKIGFTTGFFEVEFREENALELWLNYGNSYKNEKLDLSKCIEEKRNTKCNITVDLSDYDEQEIEYWFNITDIAGNHDESKKLELKVDFSPPIINYFNYTIDKNRVKFIFNITEPNFDEISYYDYNSGKQRWERLCSRLKNGICEAKSNFKDGEHNLTIQVLDEIGNKVILNIEFFIDSKKPRIRRTLPRSNSVINGSEFYVKYTEENLQNITLFYGTGTENIPKYDCEAGSNKECIFSDVDLTSYDGEYIGFWFVVSDFVFSTESRKTRVLVDTTIPKLIIYSPVDNEVYGRRMRFDIESSEKVRLEYRDEADTRPRWKTLCTSCSEYNRTKTFRRGSHEIIMRARDKAGNSDSAQINFKVDY